MELGAPGPHNAGSTDLSEASGQLITLTDTSLSSAKLHTAQRITLCDRGETTLSSLSRLDPKKITDWPDLGNIMAYGQKINREGPKIEFKLKTDSPPQTNLSTHLVQLVHRVES